MVLYSLLIVLLIFISYFSWGMIGFLLLFFWNLIGRFYWSEAEGLRIKRCIIELLYYSFQGSIFF